MKIRRKRIFEAGEENVQQQNTTAPATQQPEQTEEQKKAQERSNGVVELINGWKTAIEKNDVYGAFAVNIPATIGKKFEGFDKQQEAAATIEAWKGFEQNPSKDNFDKFLNEFGKYGNGGQEVPAQQPTQQTTTQAPPADQQQQTTTVQQPVAPQATTQTAAPAAPANQTQPTQQENLQQVNDSQIVDALSKHIVSESKELDFTERLRKNINESMKMANAEKVVRDYYHTHGVYTNRFLF